MKKKLIFIFIVICIAIFGVYLGLSDFKIPDGVDKIYHFGSFFIVTIVVSGACYYAFSTKAWFNYFLITICLIGGTAGALVEKLQEYYSINRTSEYEDWLANIAGITIGIILIYLFKIYDERKQRAKE